MTDTDVRLKMVEEKCKMVDTLAVNTGVLVSQMTSMDETVREVKTDMRGIREKMDGLVVRVALITGGISTASFLAQFLLRK